MKCDCNTTPHKFSCETRRMDNINVAIRKMCEYAGHDYNTVPFDADSHWYHEYTMTALQEQRFKEWLGAFLLTNWHGILQRKPSRVKQLHQAVDEFIMMYGLRIREAE